MLEPEEFLCHDRFSFDNFCLMVLSMLPYMLLYHFEINEMDTSQFLHKGINVSGHANINDVKRLFPCGKVRLDHLRFDEHVPASIGGKNDIRSVDRFHQTVHRQYIRVIFCMNMLPVWRILAKKNDVPKSYTMEIIGRQFSHFSCTYDKDLHSVVKGVQLTQTVNGCATKRYSEASEQSFTSNTFSRAKRPLEHSK